jgi:hypothetical protein
VRQTDPYGLRNNDAEETAGCGVFRRGTRGQWTYEVAPGCENLPVNCVSYWDACRFANWLHNGQGTGDTESGAYELRGYNGHDGRSIVRQPRARWFVPSEDEWYKGAYFDPEKPGGPGYWKYPTRSDEAPHRDPDRPGGVNHFRDGYVDPVRYLTPVGRYRQSPSPLGTFDQGGNVAEWVETLQRPPFVRVLRGGCWATAEGGLNERLPHDSVTSLDENQTMGFRIAALVEGEPAPVFPAMGASVAREPATNPEPVRWRPWRHPQTGRPFFPMGWYTWRFGGETLPDDLAEWAREGSNCVLLVETPADVDIPAEQAARNRATIRRQLDQCDAAGLKCLLQLGGWYRGFRDNDPAQQQLMRLFVEEVSGHPALLGYQLFDEPEYKLGEVFKEEDRRSSARFIEGMVQTRAALHRWDRNPHHTVQVVFNRVPDSQWRRVLPAVDGFQVDRYPIHAAAGFLAQQGDWGPLIMAWSIAHGVETARGLGLQSPVPVMQGVGASHDEGGGGDGFHWRNPAWEETRYMAYSSFSVGGWGFLHWIRDKSCPAITRNVARLQSEFQALLPALERIDQPPPFSCRHNHESISRTFLTDGIPDLTTVALADDRHWYLVVVNNAGVFDDVTLRLQFPPDSQPREAVMATVLGEDWSRPCTRDPRTNDWLLPRHAMSFGDVNVWVLPRPQPTE